MATLNPDIAERRHGIDRRASAGETASTRMSTLDWIALALMIVGGLNWGLVGLFNFDLVAALFGGVPGTYSGLTRTVFVIVGAAALYGFALLAPLSGRTTADMRVPRG